MTIPPFVRTCLAASFATAGLMGCNSNQAQLLALRDEAQRQMQAKDKTIEDQNQKLAELRAQMDQMQLQASKTAVDPDKIASAVSEAVSKQLAAQGKTLAELKRSVEQLSQGGGGGGGAPPTRTAAGGTAPAQLPPVPEPPVPSKPANRPTATRDVDKSSDSHNGAIKEKFEFPK